MAKCNHMLHFLVLEQLPSISVPMPSCIGNEFVAHIVRTLFAMSTAAAVQVQVTTPARQPEIFLRCTEEKVERS